MTNVVSKIQTMSSNEEKTTIINNLKVTHQSKWVNPECALRGLDHSNAAFAALWELIRDDKVKVRQVQIKSKHGSTIHADLYRYNGINEFYTSKS